MISFLKAVRRMNLVFWIGALFLFHGALYFLLGTANWLMVTLLATGTWTLFLVILKGVSRAVLGERDTA